MVRATTQLPYCGHEKEDGHHTFFLCYNWTEERHHLEGVVGPIAPENIVEKMLNKQKKWTDVALYIEKVLRKKKQTETAPPLQ